MQAGVIFAGVADDGAQWPGRADRSSWRVWLRHAKRSQNSPDLRGRPRLRPSRGIARRPAAAERGNAYATATGTGHRLKNDSFASSVETLDDAVGGQRVGQASLIRVLTGSGDVGGAVRATGRPFAGAHDLRAECRLMSQGYMCCSRHDRAEQCPFMARSSRQGTLRRARGGVQRSPS